MAQTPNEKGTALERAVAAIESTILEREPELRGRKLSIECRKIVVVRGVKHEIDIFVTIPRDRGYDAVFIFECKNTAEKVGKNEIIVFAEKIDVACATRGFFVATGFGEYALAQAAQNSRLVLVQAAEDFSWGGFFENFYLDGNSNPTLRFTMKERGTRAAVKPVQTMSLRALALMRLPECRARFGVSH